MTDKTQDQLRKDKDLLEGEVGSLALLVEQQQAALQLAEEALKGLKYLKTRSGRIIFEVWFKDESKKILEALTAIQEAKSTSHPQPDPSQDQE